MENRKTSVKNGKFREAQKLFDKAKANLEEGYREGTLAWLALHRPDVLARMREKEALLNLTWTALLRNEGRMEEFKKALIGWYTEKQFGQMLVPCERGLHEKRKIAV